MKIAIFSGYGGFYIPSFIENDKRYKIIPNKQENEAKRRKIMADIIEELPYTHKELNQDVFSEFTSRKNKKEYLKTESDPNVIYVKNIKNTPIYSIEITLEEVDSSIPWKIDEYDGAEGIEYWNEPKIIDKELGYAEF